MKTDNHKEIDKFLTNINNILHNKNRIGIMTILMLNNNVTFSYLKEHLDMTDGNLNSHLTTLEKNDFISVEKKFVDKKPQTSYKVTNTGRKIFLDYMNHLENIIKQVKER